MAKTTLRPLGIITTVAGALTLVSGGLTLASGILTIIKTTHKH